MSENLTYGLHADYFLPIIIIVIGVVMYSTLFTSFQNNLIWSSINLEKQYDQTDNTTTITIIVKKPITYVKLNICNEHKYYEEVIGTATIKLDEKTRIKTIIIKINGKLEQGELRPCIQELKKQNTINFIISLITRN